MDGAPSASALREAQIAVNIFGDDMPASAEAMALLARTGALPRLYRWNDLIHAGARLKAEVSVLMPVDAPTAFATLGSMDEVIPGCLAVLPGGTASALATALELGADSAVAGPCPPDLLLAQVAAIVRLRRREARSEPPSRTDSGWRFDPVFGQLKPPDGRWLPVTPVDVAVLSVLFREPDMVWTVDDLSFDLPEGRCPRPTLVRTRLTRLRKRLQKVSDVPLIENVHGRGYRLVGSSTGQARSGQA